MASRIKCDVSVLREPVLLELNWSLPVSVVLRHIFLKIGNGFV